MNIVLAGAGQVGAYIVEELSSEKHNIIVIDSDRTRIDSIVNMYDVRGVCGGGAQADVMLEAGVNNADMFIAVTSMDEVNILCCLMAKSLGAKFTVARVRSPEYSSQAQFMALHLGINLIVNPEMTLAGNIGRMLRYPAATDVDSLIHGKVDLVEYEIRQNCPLLGVKLCDVVASFGVNFLLCAVRRNGKTIIPNGEYVFCIGDKITFTATPKDINLFFRKVKAIRGKTRSCIITGGGMAVYYLAKGLDAGGIEVKIIEHEREKCEWLREMLPDSITVINGNSTDPQVMLEEGICETNALVTLCGSDEKNIVISLFAKNKHVNKIITKVNNDANLSILQGIDLDTIVSPKRDAALQIVRFARAISGGHGAVKRLYRIAGDTVEVLIFYLDSDSKLVGKKVKDLKLKANTLITCVHRGEKEIIFVNGSTQLMSGDTIAVVTAHKVSTLDELVN